jgi:sensor c-di-GMP phosphodiesterase-like protein
MKKLRANGHKLMIDDYGKGYASLSYPRNLPRSMPSRSIRNS